MNSASRHRSKSRRIALTAFLSPSAEIDADKVDLLERIDACGTISEAARSLGISYRQAWNLLEEMNRTFTEPLTEAVAGGRTGGGAALSGMGRRVMEAYRAMERRAEAAVAKEHAALQGLLAPEETERSLSARNTLVGKIVSVESDDIMTKVKLVLRDGQTMTALVTTESLSDIRLRKGNKVKAVIKATKVIIGKKDGAEEEGWSRP